MYENKSKTAYKTIEGGKTNGFDSWGGWISGFAVEGGKSNFCDSWGRESRLFSEIEYQYRDASMAYFGEECNLNCGPICR